MDYSLPGFSVHGILQARILEWVTISFSRGSSWPRDQTRVSCIGGRCFNLWATREDRLEKNEMKSYHQSLKRRIGVFVNRSSDHCKNLHMMWREPKKINYTHGVFTFLPWNLFLSSNCWLHVGSYHKTFKVHLFLFDEVMKQLWALFCFGKFFNKRQNTLRPLIVDPFLILWFSV